MKEVNPCISSGCPGLCCQNTEIEVTKYEVTRLFPDATKVNTLWQYMKLKNEGKTGAFYLKYEKETPKGISGIIKINGICPNQNPDGSCDKHIEREYAARNFDIGCTDCNVIRKENGLAPIYIEPVE